MHQREQQKFVYKDRLLKHKENFLELALVDIFTDFQQSVKGTGWRHHSRPIFF